MTKYFPPLEKGPISTIRTIQRLMIEDPSYLDGSPYDAEIVAWLKTSVPQTQVDLNAPIEDLETEATKLYRFLRGLQPEGLLKGDKGALDYARVATSLLEKLLTVVERAAKVKEVGDFQNNVIEFMQDILSPEQRTLFMDRVINVVR